MTYLLKNYQAGIFILLIIIIYFLLRLPNLTIQPIFADEAIYIRWAQVMKSEPTLRFLPLSDGKTPLFMWVMIPFFKVFEDPLFAGRILSVFTGLGTLLAGLFLGWKFFNLRVGLLSMFLIATTPYLIFFDRMALVDSMLAFFTIWSLNLGLLLAKYQRLDIAMTLGFFLGGGLLTKTPAFFNILVLPLTIFTFKNWKSKTRTNKILKIFLLWIVSVGIGFTIYNILRLGPGFSNLASRNQDYVHPPARFFEYFLDPFKPHFFNFSEVAVSLMGIIVVGLVLIGILRVILEREMVGIVIIFWALFPFLVQLSLLKVFTGRYVLFSIPLFLMIAALGWDFILRKLKFKLVPVIISLLILSFYPIYFVYLLNTNLEKLPLAKNERRGYLEDWTAGYGLKEIAEYLKNEAKKSGKVVVGTEGSFGTLPDALQIYLDKSTDVVVIGGKATISAQLRNSAQDQPTYFVANKSRYPEEYFDKNIELIKVYPKIYSDKSKQDAMLLFRVYPLGQENK